VPRRQPTPPERSPEERARAAAERAARRGETAPPPETFLARNAQPPEPAPSDEDPFRVERARPAPPDAEPASDGSWFDQETAPQATQEFQPEWLEEDDAVEWEMPEPAPQPVMPKPKTKTKTKSRPAMPPRRPRRPVYAGNGRAPRPSRWGRRVLAVLALGLIGGALWLINATFQPFHAEPTGAVAVTVPPGVDAGEIGKLLEDAGVIDSARLFEANATVTLRRAKLRPGKYTLPKGMSNGAAIEALMQGPKAKVVKTFKFTIPEGRSIRENAPAVDKGPFAGSYTKAAKSASAIKRAHTLGLPRASKNLEGFLFPATYEMISGASSGDLVKRQLDAYEQNVKSVPMKTARRRNLTRYDVLIIASMVEREAQLKRERPLIAAVIHNRLREGMPLGIDATIRYDINNWARPLRVSELERDTPYNTRTRRGLPPTPIGNPGVDSIKAAANPANVKYLFFVRKPGKSGEHAFSKTNAQFERDVARYQASRGGP
jgi:peptidoglycan lytic transglycosylase G